MTNGLFNLSRQACKASSFFKTRQVCRSYCDECSFRPGPLNTFLFYCRKHGREEISHDLEGMEDYLSETYGITVYQEQVMLLSQKLAGFSKGDADMLRKAMGKKIFSLLEKTNHNLLKVVLNVIVTQVQLEKFGKTVKLCCVRF